MSSAIETQAFVELVDEMLESGHFETDREALERLHDAVCRDRRVTEDQRRAVAAIALNDRAWRGRRESDGRVVPSSRRYEGYEGPR